MKADERDELDDVSEDQLRTSCAFHQKVEATTEDALVATVQFRPTRNKNPTKKREHGMSNGAPGWEPMKSRSGRETWGTPTGS